VRVTLRRRVLKLATPLETSYGTVGGRELIVLGLTDEDGITGHGEAAPLAGYDGVSGDRVHRALRSYLPVLEAPSPPGVRLMDACRQIDELPQALAAVDLALWDLAGHREGRPVSDLLSDRAVERVPVNATIAATDRAGAAAGSADAVALGFSCIKLKVGMGDDAGRVAAVRAAVGSETALRLDANGAWSVPEAIAAIEALAPAGLELVEEPTRGLHAVRQVRDHVAVRVAIDETAAEPGALGAGVADAVCLKISRCGGIGGLVAAAALVRASGAEVYVASTLDGPLGIAASLHAAAALAGHGPLPPCGLATLGLFLDEPNPLPVVKGAMAVPRTPGLGIGPGA